MSQQQQESAQREQGQQGQYQQTGQYDESRPQSQFDSAFVEQIDPTSAAMFGAGPVDWAREYFNQAEQTLLTARRITELQTLHLMRQQIVAQVTASVTQKVLAAIRQNPSLVTSGSASSSSSPSGSRRLG